MAAPTTAQLKTELTTDPGGVAYAAALTNGDAGALLAALNLVRSGNAADGKSYTVFRNDIAAKEAANAITAADFTALTTIQLAKLQFLFLGGTVDATIPNVRANFANIFTGATLAALNALAQRNGSRAEALWGTGVPITLDMIQAALKP